jgi:phosphoglycerate dehydrogenase-like enzyme
MLICGKTIGIVGLGNIGKEIARMSKAYGMKVLGTRRSVREVTGGRNVDLLLPSSRMNELLAQSDFVVLAVPSITETVNLIGRRELKSMKPGAFLVNIARGSVIDEDALIWALENNIIAGAGLDTFAEEPLQPHSRLWHFPNVIITPHLAGRLENYYDVATDIFCENLKRYLSGKRLIKLVNKKRGY